MLLRYHTSQLWCLPVHLMTVQDESRRYRWVCRNMLHLLAFRLWPRPKDTFGSWRVLAMIELARVDAGNVLSAKCFNLLILKCCNQSGTRTGMKKNLWNIELQGEEKDKCQQNSLARSLAFQRQWKPLGSWLEFFFSVSTVRTSNYFKFQDNEKAFRRVPQFCCGRLIETAIRSHG